MSSSEKSRVCLSSFPRNEVKQHLNKRFDDEGRCGSPKSSRRPHKISLQFKRRTPSKYRRERSSALRRASKEDKIYCKTSPSWFELNLMFVVFSSVLAYGTTAKLFVRGCLGRLEKWVSDVNSLNLKKKNSRYWFSGNARDSRNVDARLVSNRLSLFKS